MIKVSYNWAKQYTSTLKANVSNWQIPITGPPKFGNWIQLNSDGAVKEDFDLATIEGILHERYGRWILRYNRFVGICSVLNAEEFQ